MNLPKNRRDEWELLKNVAEGYELDIITSMLAQLNIPIQKKSRGSGAYTSIYMGMSITGYDVYVPADRLLEAQEVLADIEPLDMNYTEEAGREMADEPNGYILRYRKLFKNILMFLLIILTLILVSIGLYQSFISIYRMFLLNR